MGQPPQRLGEHLAALQVPCLHQPLWGDMLAGDTFMESRGEAGLSSPPQTPPSGGASQLSLAGNPEPLPSSPSVCQ